MNMEKTVSGDSLVFVAAKRTPFGAFGGSFKDTSATDLAVHASKACLAQIGAAPTDIDQVIFGNVIPSSADGAYLSRHVGLKTGLPITVPALTLNRLCGSGFEALADGARRIRLSEATTILGGGTENMSQAPFVLRQARFGYRMGHGELEDSLIAGLFDTYPKTPMAITAENLAERYEISRDACDAFSLSSQKKAAAADLSAEIAPVELTSRGKTTRVEKDEHPRPETSIESLKKLKPLFKENGRVTAGTASGICDGAASLILTTRKNAEQKGWPVLATWIGSHVTGCEPKEMGIGPVSATLGLLQRCALKKEDVTLVEINEAFAAQVLAVQKELKFPDEKLNTCGGAIALGHPLGASGARLTTHLIYELKKKGGGIGLGTACIGGGQGIAVLLQV